MQNSPHDLVNIDLFNRNLVNTDSVDIDTMGAKEEVAIFSLRDRPEYIHELAQWHQLEWCNSGYTVTISRRVQRLRTHLQSEGLPCTWLAMQADRLVGSVSLVNYAFAQNSFTTAWLANLFVVPTQRRKGLGHQLLAYAEQQASLLGLKELFLFTPNRRQYYESHQWSFTHQSRVRGQWVDVMKKALFDAQPGLLPPSCGRSTPLNLRW